MIMGQPIITGSCFIWNRISRPQLVIISFQIKVRVISLLFCLTLVLQLFFPISAETRKTGPYIFRFVALRMRMRSPQFGLQCVFYLKLSKCLSYMSANSKVSSETELMVISILFSGAGYFFLYQNQ